MRLGKLPEIIYSRSVDKKIRTHNNKLKGAGTDCAFLCTEGIELGIDGQLHSTEIAMLFRFVFYKAAAVAGKPAMVQAQITLPEDFEESKLRDIISILTDYSFEYRLLIAGVDVTTQAFARAAHINLILMGSLADSRNLISKGKKKIQSRQLVYVGRAGSAGTALLARRYCRELTDRYSQDYVRRMAGVFEETAVRYTIVGNEETDTKIEPSDSYAVAERIFAECDRKIVSKAFDMGASIVPVGEGGAFAALWAIGSEYGCGLNVNLKAIPIYQETVELCDFFDINPYMLESCGDCIIICDDAKHLVEELSEMAVEVSFIGSLTDNNARVIINNDEERFLTAPEQDEIFRASARGE